MHNDRSAWHLHNGIMRNWCLPEEVTFALSRMEQNAGGQGTNGTGQVEGGDGGRQIEPGWKDMWLQDVPYPIPLPRLDLVTQTWASKFTHGCSTAKS